MLPMRPLSPLRWHGTAPPAGPGSPPSRSAGSGALGRPDGDMSTYPGARGARVACVSLEALEERE